MRSLFPVENDALRDGLGLGLLLVVIASAQWLGAAFGV